MNYLQVFIAFFSRGEIFTKYIPNFFSRGEFFANLMKYSNIKFLHENLRDKVNISPHTLLTLRSNREPNSVPLSEFQKILEKSNTMEHFSNTSL